MQDKNVEIDHSAQGKRLTLSAIGVIGIMFIGAVFVGALLPDPPKPSTTTASTTGATTPTPPAPAPPAPAATTYEPTPVASSLPDRNTVGSIILSVACGSQVGMVSRSETGSQIKSLLEGEGINPQVVYDNWDYYYSRAKEMNDFKGYSCVQ